MPRFTAAGLTTVTSSGAATLAVRAGAADITLWEIFCGLNAATASIAGLYRSTAAGTPSTTITPTNEDKGAVQAALSRCDTAWSVQPTLASVPMRMGAAPAAVGNYWIWQFDKGLYIPASGTVVVKLEQASSALRWHAVLEE